MPATRTSASPAPHADTHPQPTTTSPPHWAKEAVWYQIMPERFRKGYDTNILTPDGLEYTRIKGWHPRAWAREWYALDPWEKKCDGFHRAVYHRRYGGDIEGIRQALPYLHDLGVNALYLTPVFYARSLHKYDATCHHHIDPYFGPDPAGDIARIHAANETHDPSTWIWTAADKDFLALVREIHAYDMRIIIDGVFNHTGRDFFAFKDIIAHGKNSSYVHWYDIKGWGDAFLHGVDVQGWAGVTGLPQFARDKTSLHPDVRDYVFAITRRWMQPQGNAVSDDSIDGWRLDVAECLPLGFWREWCDYVRSLNPQAYTTAELFTVSPEYIEAGFDAHMNYPLYFAILQFFITHNARLSPTAFDAHMQKLREAYPSETPYVMQNLIGSHDVQRIASAIANPALDPRDWHAYHMNTKCRHNPAYIVRKPSQDAYQRLKLIVLFHMTYCGAPMIYYGDEVGMWGANDPCNRKPMLWSHCHYEPETTAPDGATHDPDPVACDTTLHSYYRSLIHLRRTTPALNHGTYQTVYTDDDRHVIAYTRTHKNACILVVINAGDTAVDIPWESLVPQHTWHRLFPATTAAHTHACRLDAVSGAIYHSV